MNDSVPGEPQAPMAGSESSAPAGFGSMLAQARARAGLSIEEAAARLRLHPRQLDALEREDLEALPAAAYVGGFVRNYARELKIDPQPLMDDLKAKLALRGLGGDALGLRSPGAARARPLDERGWRHLMLAGIVAVLVCALLIGSWMAHVRERAARAAAAAPPPAARIAPARGAPTETIARAPVAVPETNGGSTLQASVAADGASGSSGPALTPTPAPQAAEGQKSAVARAVGEGPGVTAAGVRAATVGLLLRFNERSWFEISQADGRVLMSRNGEAGSLEMLNTSAPLVLVVGRADVVRVEYRGKPVDLKPYVNNNGVARLMFADGRVTSGGSTNR
jgi:cytoskeleton protein RodZ